MNWIKWIVMVLALLSLVGCMTVQKNQGEMGLRYGTEVTFFSRASQTSPEEATNSVTIPTLDKVIDGVMKPTPSDGN